MSADAPEVRRADPAARRQLVLSVVLCVLVGALLIAGFDAYANALRDWLRSQPSEMARRLRLLLLLGAGLLSVPLIVFAAYLWSLGARVVVTQEFPPPGYRVIRDTPVVAGRGAVRRGRGLEIVALVLGAASVLLWLAIWQLARVLPGNG